MLEREFSSVESRVLGIIQISLKAKTIIFVVTESCSCRRILRNSSVQTCIQACGSAGNVLLESHPCSGLHNLVISMTLKGALDSGYILLIA